MQIHELPTSGVSDTDKLAFDTGANTYSGTFSSIAASVLSKLTSQTFSALTTTAKTVIGAINELKTALSNTSLVTTFTSLTFSSLNTSNKTLPGAINELNNNLTYANFTDLVNWTNGTPTSGANGFYRYGKICIVSIDFTSPSSVSTDAVVATLPSGYQASARFPFLVFPAWQANKTNICHVWYGNIVLAGSAWTANTRYVGQAVYIIQ